MKTESEMRRVLLALQDGTYHPEASSEWRKGAIAVLRWALYAED